MEETGEITQFCAQCGKPMKLLPACPACGTPNEFLDYPLPPSAAGIDGGEPGAHPPKAPAAAGSDSRARVGEPARRVDPTVKVEEAREEHTDVTRTWSPGPGESGPVAALICEGAPDEEQVFRLDVGAALVGRKDAPIRLNSPNVSRRHAELRVEVRDGAPPAIVLTDLESKSGTYLNGRRLGRGETAPVEDGDVVQFAEVRYRVRITASRPATSRPDSPGESERSSGTVTAKDPRFFPGKR